MARCSAKSCCSSGECVWLSQWCLALLLLLLWLQACASAGAAVNCALAFERSGLYE
jgi:hypothetical protein